MKTLPSFSARLTRARVEPDTETTFQFTDTTDTGFIAEILAAPDWSGEIVELIAWRPEAPHRWWLRAGTMPILGEDLAEFTATVRKEPVHLVATPAEWHREVKAGRDNVACIVDWSADPRLVLTGLTLRCAPALNRRVQAWWAEHSRPHFTLTTERVSHAA